MKPILQALILADRIYQDVSGKKIIAGTFNRLMFKRGGAKPREVEEGGVKKTVVAAGGQPGSPYAYISLTDVHGTVNCILRYVDLQADQPLLQCPFKIECKDPLQTIEIVIPLPRLPTVKAGVHALELLCEGEPIGSLRIHVDEMKDEAPGP